MVAQVWVLELGRMKPSGVFSRTLGCVTVSVRVRIVEVAALFDGLDAIGIVWVRVRIRAW